VTPLVFEKGDVIGVYNGDRYRPCDASIADYSVGHVDQGQEVDIDSLQYRGFVSYVNQPYGAQKENCRVDKRLRLVATRNVYHDEQLFWKYGPKYVNGEPIEVKRG